LGLSGTPTPKTSIPASSYEDIDKPEEIVSLSSVGPAIIKIMDVG